MPEDATDSVLEDSLARAERAVALRDARGLKSREVLAAQLQSLSTSLDRHLKRQLRALGSADGQLSGGQIVVLIGLATLAVERAVALLNVRLDIQRRHGLASAATDTHAMVSGMESLVGNHTSFARAALHRTMETMGFGETLLATQRASVERYGVALIQELNKVLYAGIRDRLPQREVVSQVSGLLVEKKWWAERIVRTETARAYNAATDLAIGAYNAAGTPLHKKIIAFFDNRTAYDSVFVHGQVRATGEYFMDGAGRQYLYPPGRSNDREVIIPWGTRWPEGSRTRAIPAGSMPSPPRRRDIVKTATPQSSINVLR